MGLGILLAVLAPLAAVSDPIVLDGDVLGLTFRGIGGLSAGASSRLVYDYPEPQRSDILDFLFKPDFGAGLQINKIEIGGGVQSTDGTEASHMYTRDDLSYNRGYEYWLAAEAKKRNPDIKTYALSWGVPHWIGNGSYFSPDNWLYQTKFVEGAAKMWNVSVDYIGIWNERPWGTADYIKGLRKTLDEAGFTDTKIIGADGRIQQDELDALQADKDFRAAVFGLGNHYPCRKTSPGTIALGLDYWANEDFSTVADWTGAGCWGRSIMQNYVRLNATATISWSTIWGVSQWDLYALNGLMYAFEPWSGAYEVKDTIWTSAHVGQFSKPGWRYLGGSGAGLIGEDGANGSYAVLVPPASEEAGAGPTPFTLVIETLHGKCLRCAGSSAQDQTLTFQLAGSIKTAAPLHVWRTVRGDSFRQLSDVTPDATGTFSIEVKGDAMYTVTTLTGQSKGKPSSPIPPSKPFPLPYADDYDSSALEKPGRYHSDEGGSFEIAKDPFNPSSGNQVLKQMVPIDAGKNRWIPDPLPVTMVGPSAARDLTISASALILSNTTVEPQDTSLLMVGVCTRVTTRYNSGVCLLYGQLNGTASPCTWRICDGSKGQGSGCAPLASGNCPPTAAGPSSFASTWHNLSLSVSGATATGTVDGTAVGPVQLPPSLVVTGTASLTSGITFSAFDNLRIGGSNPTDGTPLVSAALVAGSDIRNDFDGFVGFRLSLNVTTPASAPITVTALGRYCASPGANQTHNMSIFDATEWPADPSPKLVASVSLDAKALCSSPALASSGFAYAPLPSKVTLTPPRVYFVVSEEHAGGDSFFGRSHVPRIFFRLGMGVYDDQPVGVYQMPDGWYTEGAGSTYGSSYGPLDVLFE